MPRNVHGGGTVRPVIGASSANQTFSDTSKVMFRVPNGYDAHVKQLHMATNAGGVFIISMKIIKNWNGSGEEVYIFHDESISASSPSTVNVDFVMHGTELGNDEFVIENPSGNTISMIVYGEISESYLPTAWTVGELPPYKHIR